MIFSKEWSDNRRDSWKIYDSTCDHIDCVYLKLWAIYDQHGWTNHYACRLWDQCQQGTRSLHQNRRRISTCSFSCYECRLVSGRLAPILYVSIPSVSENAVKYLSVRYIPEWFPGAKFQREAREWRVPVFDMLNKPFEFIKSRMVRGCPVTYWSA